VSISDPATVGAPNGLIYVFGNDVVVTYNTATKVWSTPSPTLSSEGMGAALAGDGKIYLAGGLYGHGPGGGPSNWVLVFDPSAGSWSGQSNLLRGEQSPALLVVNGTNLYAFGGWTGEGTDLGMQGATIQ
jgi:N-acetylneuraminic acid mutarotase